MCSHNPEDLEILSASVFGALSALLKDVAIGLGLIEFARILQTLDGGSVRTQPKIQHDEALRQRPKFQAQQINGINSI
jgi:hypothetical protein